MDMTLFKASLLQSALEGKLTKQLSNNSSVDELIANMVNEKSRLIKEKKIKKSKPLAPISEDEILFKIPKTWRWVRLGELGEIIGGGTPKKVISEYWEDGNIPWLTPADMRSIEGKFITEGGNRNITELGLSKSSARLINENSILYSSRAPIGYIGINTLPISTNQGFKSVSLFNKELVNYLYYALKTQTPSIISRASGTTFLEISGT
jgi:type I restriction enzyme S subunit